MACGRLGGERSVLPHRRTDVVRDALIMALRPTSRYALGVRTAQPEAYLIQ